MDRARELRAKHMANALASVRMEGLEPSDEAKALFQRCVDGELTTEELRQAIKEILDRDYGSVRLPGN
jgi:hypothetical protein